MNTRKAVTRKRYNFQATFKIVAEGKHFGELVYGRYATRANGEKRFLDFVTKIGNGTIRLPLGVPLY